MPIPAQRITTAILQAAEGQGLAGAGFKPIAAAVGKSVAQWLPTGVTVKAATTGAAGAGTVQGFLTVPPLPGAAPLFALQGMQGPQAWKMAIAISLGISASVSGAPFTGLSATVGTGAAVAKVTWANASSLAPLLINNLPATFQSEVQTPSQAQLAVAISTIVAAQLLLGYGTGVVVGSASPAWAVGTATCTL